MDFMLIVQCGHLTLESTLIECETPYLGEHLECGTLYIGEHLDCAFQSGNSQNPFADVGQKVDETIGYVPQTISCICLLSLQQHGAMSCTVARDRRNSKKFCMVV